MVSNPFLDSPPSNGYGAKSQVTSHDPCSVRQQNYIRRYLVTLAIKFHMSGSNRRVTKFVRHRDLKMKESELKCEAKTQRLMVEGICEHCREILKWKFKYDKYRPLRKVGLVYALTIHYTLVIHPSI